MKIFTAKLTYKCGCSYNTQYPRGATQTEVKRAQAINKTRLCPNCEDEQGSAMRADSKEAV